MIVKYFKDFWTASLLKPFFQKLTNFGNLRLLYNNNIAFFQILL